MKNRAVIFDMDGVIVDSNPYHKKALIQFCEKHGHFLSDEELKSRIYGRTNKDWITNLFGQIPVSQVKAYAEEKEALYREIYAEKVKEVPGFSTFVHQLKERGFLIAIATSAPRKNVDFTLSGIGLPERLFDAILDDSYVEKGKPNPEIYLKTATALNIAPSQCVVFEDSVSGVSSGVAAGMKVIGVLTTHTETELPGTSYCIADFEKMNLSRLEAIIGW